MDLADRVSESLIKIFHNAKGSIINDVARWTEDLDAEDQIDKSPLTDEPLNKLEKDLPNHEQYKTSISN